jgi:CRISPR system Cascade subunit CasE
LPGAAIEQVVLDAFRLSRVRRRNNERVLRSQNGPEASFSGILRVIDGAALSAALARGIGRHRAFGFGMLLLRPAR